MKYNIRNNRTFKNFILILFIDTIFDRKIEKLEEVKIFYRKELLNIYKSNSSEKDNFIVTYSKTFNSIIDELETIDTEKITTFNRFLEFGFNLVQTTQELREEILDFDNIYQFYVNDINYEFWIKISKGSIIYKEGVNENSDLRIFLTKNLIIRLTKQEITIIDAYMKGLLNMQGDISQAVKFRNLIKFYREYVKKTFNLEE